MAGENIFDPLIGALLQRGPAFFDPTLIVAAVENAWLPIVAHVPEGVFRLDEVPIGADLVDQV